jgi:hypothetical protein
MSSHLWRVHAHYSPQLVERWTYVSSLLLSHTPHRSRTGTTGWGAWRMLWRVRERSRPSSLSQLWVVGSLSPYDVIIYLFFVQNTYYIVKMWHSFLYHDSSYVWDLDPAHLVLCSRPGLGAPKLGCDTVTPGFKGQSWVHLIYVPEKTTHIIKECIEINVINIIRVLNTLRKSYKINDKIKRTKYYSLAPQSWLGDAT